MFDYLSFAFLLLLGQLSPGPDFLLVLKNSLNHNLRAALFTVAGITTGIIIHTTVALAGLAYIFNKSGAAYSALRYGGSAYLAYLGVRLLLSLRKQPEPGHGGGGEDPGRELSDMAAYLQGFLTNLLNPKIIVIISSVLLMFLGDDTGFGQRLTYGVILVVEGVAVWIVIALLLQTPTAKRQFARWERTVNATFGVLLVAFAIRAAVR